MTASSHASPTTVHHGDLGRHGHQGHDGHDGHDGHQHDLKPFRHSHHFIDAGAEARSRALRATVWLTIVTMVVELGVGWWTGSLALTADGWHMGTHAAALGGALLATRLARRAHGNEAYAFGGWKIEVLAAYTSGLLLMAVSLWIVVDAVSALATPSPIRFGEALAIAVLGLAVNLASAWLLSRGAAGHDHHHHGHAHGPATSHGHDDHDHDDHHDHDDAHGPGERAPHAPRAQAAHNDHNFHAAYVHVLADAFTSLLAIAALAGGLLWGWTWLDAAVAFVGAAVIGRWSWGVLGGSARALVDATADHGLRTAVRRAVESDGDAQLADLHVWQVGPGAFAAAISVVADAPLAPEAYQQRLQRVSALKHATVEVHRCRG